MFGELGRRNNTPKAAKSICGNNANEIDLLGLYSILQVQINLVRY